jgi:hypothetical protein
MTSPIIVPRSFPRAFQGFRPRADESIAARTIFPNQDEVARQPPIASAALVRILENFHIRFELDERRLSAFQARVAHANQFVAYQVVTFLFGIETLEKFRVIFIMHVLSQLFAQYANAFDATWFHPQNPF